MMRAEYGAANIEAALVSSIAPYSARITYHLPLIPAWLDRSRRKG